MLSVLNIIFLEATRQDSTTINLTELEKKKQFVVYNRQLSLAGEAERNAVSLNENGGEGLGWLTNVTFSTGTIEIDLKGQDVYQKSFLGIAFHGVNDSTYDAVYFRPFNFQSPDAIRKSHSVQYICLPKYEWYYLRENYPAKYENTLTQSIEATSWFHAKIVVTKNSIDVYVNGDNKPSLTVQPLADYSKGNVGFWVGNNSDGDFSNITIKQD